VSCARSHPWWVAHVKSRQEKTLARHLQPLGIPYYLPQREQKIRDDQPLLEKGRLAGPPEGAEECVARFSVCTPKGTERE
jgi:hypothetical protein